MCKVYEPTKAVYGVLPFNIVVPGINLLCYTHITYLFLALEKVQV